MVRPHCVLAGAAATCLGIAGWLLAVDAPKTARIEEVDASKAPLRITRDLSPGAINAMQYGQFIEYLCNLVPGMWAEKLYDGGFEGLSPYKFVYLKETDFREKPWYPCDATNRAEYVLDRNNKVGGDTAQRIAVKDGSPCTVGIAQDGVAVDKGTACEFSCHLRQQGIDGPVQVRLEQEGKELASCNFQPGGEWKKYHARLAPAETATNATLRITFRGPGTLWLDNASLMPSDNVGGWRRDVVEAVKALKPGVIRFGGTALDDPNLGDFEWKDTVGDADKRKPFRAWGGLQPTGPGLEEIVQFCRLVDAEPLICVRFSERQPERCRGGGAVFQRRHGHADGQAAREERPSRNRTISSSGRSATSGRVRTTRRDWRRSARR